MQRSRKHSPPPVSALDNPEGCPITSVLSVLGGKWKIPLLWHLREETLRYSALRDRLPGISERMLVRSLKELQQDGLVERTSYPEVPPRVEYALTERGASLTPVLSRLAAWGIEHLTGPPEENSSASP